MLNVVFLLVNKDKQTNNNEKLLHSWKILKPEIMLCNHELSLCFNMSYIINVTVPNFCIWWKVIKNLVISLDQPWRTLKVAQGDAAPTLETTGVSYYSLIPALCRK